MAIIKNNRINQFFPCQTPAVAVVLASLNLRTSLFEFSDDQRQKQSHSY